jgi:hypothetical protein
MAHLTEMSRAATSGARAVEPFRAGGLSLVAVPQLATDVPGAPPDMNGGDSDTSLLLLSWDGTDLREHQRLAAPGGEDAEFFRIGDRAFLAVASLRTGRGPYEFAVPSRIFEWLDGRFEPFQQVPTFAAKQMKAFTVGDRHFLALAQGVAPPGVQLPNRPSLILEWTGERFEPFQEVPSAWGYNWHRFDIGGEAFLAYADHAVPSVLYRWDGHRFVAHQDLLDSGGRAFADVTVDGQTYLVAARLTGTSVVLRWDGGTFVPHQELDGPGAREFAVFRSAGGLHLVRVNFIHGTPKQPRTDLTSQVYRWSGGRFVVVAEFPTTGATDVAVLPAGDGGGVVLGVSHSLTRDVRFAAETVVYRFAD